MNLYEYFSRLSMSMVQTNLTYVDRLHQEHELVYVYDADFAEYEVEVVGGSRRYVYDNKVALPLRLAYHLELTHSEVFELYSGIIGSGLVVMGDTVAVASGYSTTEDWTSVDSELKYRLAASAFADFISYIPINAVRAMGARAMVFSEEEITGEEVVIESFRCLRDESDYYFRSASISQSGLTAQQFCNLAGLLTDSSLVLDDTRVYLEASDDEE